MNHRLKRLQTKIKRMVKAKGMISNMSQLEHVNRPPNNHTDKREESVSKVDNK